MGVLYRGGGYGPSQVIIGQTANGASQATARLLDQFIKLPTITVHEGGLADFPFTKDIFFLMRIALWSSGLESPEQPIRSVSMAG
jgi:hypothetical protein